MAAIFMLVNEAEEARNARECCTHYTKYYYIVRLQGPSPIPYTFINKPWREDESGDSYTLIITTPFIFNHVHSGSDQTVPKITRGSLGGMH